ncbi:homoprotocatechuate degradation operon regulator HpaR [Mesobacterium pallidum]|uniref:homoprotocatechuate degradation operon regulator HpaR n=1 Tax=Mesobacterium pallidum TaxID=2872037 RepID=UPI001EE38088|nr:homoprotocatechuate degradation operon regulator HpaR [Mesobacterium pallidum]
MADHRDGFELADTQRTLAIALLRARETVMERFRPMLGSVGVTEQQWRVLRVLQETGETDASQLAAHACILPPSLTRMLKTLETRGFLTVRRDPDDGRRQLICLTPEGTDFLHQVAPQSAEIYARIEAAIGPDRVQALLDELDHLVQALGPRD